MSCRLNKPAFEKLIAEDIEWLMKQPDSLERWHILRVLQDCQRMYYPPKPGYPEREPVDDPLEH